MNRIANHSVVRGTISARARAIALAALGAAALGSTSAAQCTPQWGDEFASSDSYFSQIASLAFDRWAAGGPVLYASCPGGGPARSLAKWQNGRWSALDDVTLPANMALAVFDADGAGAAAPLLYGGGSFSSIAGVAANSIAKWDGNDWSPLAGGLNSAASCLEVLDDDGAGPHAPALFVGGNFTAADGIPAHGVAKWDGNAWSALGVAVNGDVRAIAAFDDDGPGPHPTSIYVLGNFTTAGGAPANGIAKWDGASWSPVGSGLPAGGASLAVHDEDGPGPGLPALFAGGNFAFGGAPMATIARWDGADWTALAAGLQGLGGTSVHTLATFDEDGEGPEIPVLIAGGNFISSGSTSTPMVARWNGRAWSDVGGGLNGANVASSIVFDEDGAGPEPTSLFVAGAFSSAGGSPASGGFPAPQIARWDGDTWRAVGHGLSGPVRALAAFDDDGAGPHPTSMYVGGIFVTAGPYPARNVARFDGEEWSTLGSGVTGKVYAFAVFDDDGAGPRPPALYVGGEYTSAGGIVAGNLARWDGSTWTEVGGGTNAAVYSLCVHDADGNGPQPAALYVGGFFTSVGGGDPIQYLARWNGNAWSALGSGPNNAVQALTSFDVDGAGPAAPLLVAGGWFTSSGGVSAARVAHWNGGSWTAFGAGLSDTVYALAAFDGDGTGPSLPTLHAAGQFTASGSNTAVRFVARWQSPSWQPMGTEITHVGLSFAVFDDDGTGPNPGALHVGGGLSAGTVARWNGNEWTRLLPSPFTEVRAIASIDHDSSGSAPSMLYVGGQFIGAAGIPSDNLLRWHACGSTFETFCFGDGSLATPCPCTPPNTVPNPPAAPGHGCANSLNLNGALLTASGTTTPDTVKIRIDVAPLYAGFGFISKGNANTVNGEAASDGVRCTGGQMIRFGGHNAGTNGAPLGVWTYPNNVQTLSVSAASGQPLGETAYYQLYYRNAAAGFCNTSTANFSNGVAISWQ